MEVEATLYQHGKIRLMVHPTVNPSTIVGLPVTVSEETTGYAIPEARGVTADEALGRALAMLASYGEAKAIKAIAGKPILNP